MKQVDETVEQLELDSHGDETSEVKFSSSMQTVSQECTTDMLNFAKEIITQSVNILSDPPPCDFSVLAIGSMARGEATPYSDLEYLILIDERSESIVQYFERLAMTTYFLIGNLGETTLDYMDIVELRGWFKDCAKSGFKIDGLEEKAGNIPTGNGRADTVNHFIATPEELAARYTGVLCSPDKGAALRGDFTAMLTYTTVFYKYGEAKLRDRFISSVKQTPVPVQRRDINREMLQADTMKFNFTPDENVRDKGFMVDVKKELYRFPSILLLDLSIVFDSLANTSWETIQLLSSKGHISNYLRNSLHFMLACACYIRLSAYLHNNSHNDNVSVAPKSVVELSEDQFPSISHYRRWFTPFVLYVKLCETTIPIKKQIASLLSSVTERNRMPDLNIVKAEGNWSSRFLSMNSAGRYKDALKLLELQLEGDQILDPERVVAILPSDSEQQKMMRMISQALTGCSRYKEALKFPTLGDLREGSERSKILLSKCHSDLGDYERAFEVVESIEEKTADSYMELGSVNVELGKMDEAEVETLKALQLYYNQSSDECLYDYYGDLIEQHTLTSTDKVKPDLINCTAEQRLTLIRSVTPDIISCMRLLSYIYWRQSKFELYHKYNQTMIDLVPISYGDQALVIDVCDLYQNEAVYYQEVQQLEAALQSYMKALSLYEQLFGKDADQAEIALLLSNLGYLYNWTTDYDLAEEYSKKALDMLRRVLGENSAHEDICRTLRNLGFTYHAKGDNDKAVEYFQKPVDMLREKHGTETDHRDVADALTRLGRICTDAKRHSQSREHLTKALEMYYRIYGKDEPRMEIGAVLREFGRSYSSSKEYESALHYYRQEVDIYQKLSSDDEGSVDVAMTLFNIGDCHRKTKNYAAAEDNFQRALLEYRKLYSDESDNVDIKKTVAALDGLKNITTPNGASGSGLM